MGGNLQFSPINETLNDEQSGAVEAKGVLFGIRATWEVGTAKQVGKKEFRRQRR